MRKNWTKEETIIAFNVYCKIPFKDCNKSHPMIIKYARILGRSASALGMKVGNIGRLDPDLKNKGISGLVHGAKMEQEVWNEFKDNPEQLAFESEQLIAKFSNKTIDDLVADENLELPIGIDRESTIRQRVNQSFFRTAVLSSYNYTCCISGVNNPLLLEAAHISEWSSDKENRTNPRNGLCLNPFFHKAYDNLLIAITPDYNVVVSDELFESVKDEPFMDYLGRLDGRKIMLPDRFIPSQELLEKRYNLFTSR